MTERTYTEREEMIATLMEQYRREQLAEDIKEDVARLEEEAVKDYRDNRLTEEIADAVTELEDAAIEEYRTNHLAEDIADEVADLETLAVAEEETQLRALSDAELEELFVEMFARGDPPSCWRRG